MSVCSLVGRDLRVFARTAAVLLFMFMRVFARAAAVLLFMFNAIFLSLAVLHVVIPASPLWTHVAFRVEEKAAEEERKQSDVKQKVDEVYLQAIQEIEIEVSLFFLFCSVVFFSFLFVLFFSLFVFVVFPRAPPCPFCFALIAPDPPRSTFRHAA